MNADKKSESGNLSDPCSSAFIRGSSSFGIPRTDNGNYLWIQHFHSALNKKGRAGFVMANSAADARSSEKEIREKIIRAGHVRKPFPARRSQPSRI
jgi:type I restriction-modification system DNA methylase subunit